MDTEKSCQQLIARLKENYADYRAELLLKDRQELIAGAGKIADTVVVFHHLTERHYTEQELSHLLKFQNPLEVVTDHWDDYELLPDVLEMVVANAVDTPDDLTLYPLAADTPAKKPDGLQKFMNVDLETVLPQIMAQKTAFYQKDLTYALDTMREGAATEDPAKRNFVVIFRQSGVECLNERDMFIAGTRSYNICQYYHRQTREPVLAYSVELLGDGKNGLRANLYQQDQHQMATFTERASSPYTDVTVTFIGGKEVRIPEKEYNYETIPSLKYHYGDIMDTRNEADDESVVQGALRREHDRRERMPKGHIAVHVQKLEESRIQTEADRLAFELQSLTEPNTPDKTHFMAEVSPYFLPLASQDDMFQLFQKVQEQVKQPMYIAQLDDKRGQYFFMRREERAQEQTHKPSIKEQLAAKPVHSDQPAAKPKDREVR